MGIFVQDFSMISVPYNSTRGSCGVETLLLRLSPSGRSIIPVQILLMMVVIVSLLAQFWPRGRRRDVWKAKEDLITHSSTIEVQAKKHEVNGLLKFGSLTEEVDSGQVLSPQPFKLPLLMMRLRGLCMVLVLNLISPT